MTSDFLGDETTVDVVPDGYQVASSTAIRAAEIVLWPRLGRSEVPFPTLCVKHVSALQAAHSLAMVEVLGTDGAGLIAAFMNGYLRFDPWQP